MIIPSKDKPRDNEVSVWTVATGVIKITQKSSRKAVEYISKLKGFVGVHPMLPNGTLWLFDTKENAHMGKAKMEDKGIHTGNNIMEVFVEKKYLQGEKND